MLFEVLLQIRKVEIHLSHHLASYQTSDFLKHLLIVCKETVNQKVYKQSFLKPEHYMSIILNPDTKRMNGSITVRGQKYPLFVEAEKQKVI